MGTCDRMDYPLCPGQHYSSETDTTTAAFYVPKHGARFQRIKAAWLKNLQTPFERVEQTHSIVYTGRLYDTDV